MTVGELIQELAKFRADLPVKFYNEHCCESVSDPKLQRAFVPRASWGEPEVEVVVVKGTSSGLVECSGGVDEV